MFFSLSSFTLIKKLFSSSSLSAIRVAPCAYLRLLIFSQHSWLQLDSSSPPFHNMYCAQKLNKQSDNVQPRHTTLHQFWTTSLFHVQFCCFLIYIQVSQEAGKVVWYSPLFKNFPQFVVIHPVKGFSIVSELDIFLEILPSPWSNECWQFDLWFLCLF